MEDEGEGGGQGDGGGEGEEAHWGLLWVAGVFLMPGAVVFFYPTG